MIAVGTAPHPTKVSVITPDRVLPNRQSSARIEGSKASTLGAPVVSYRAGRHPRPARLFMEGEREAMRPATIIEDPAPRPSRLIAEALVQRHGPRRIVKRAARFGISTELTNVMVFACGATALQPRDNESIRLQSPGPS